MFRAVFVLDAEKKGQYTVPLSGGSAWDGVADTLAVRDRVGVWDGVSEIDGVCEVELDLLGVLEAEAEGEGLLVMTTAATVPPHGWLK